MDGPAVQRYDAYLNHHHHLLFIVIVYPFLSKATGMIIAVGEEGMAITDSGILHILFVKTNIFLPNHYA